ncbi:MAG: NrtA/SsuA/CpmA family ABC transporter substrate-binding protein [Candidatus Thiodiazotropha sp. (ex. Lucinisca nassula)]|nr:NrtA/SsuA/CpmA family ABC transporter substrate-binding protein [Candidatus Thiodiazotropha sp. (ex. Lucinisca nassula)]MBW9268738.1 NrtA/SsuA/CpmA family ABC transporter substrate-binding protein [Candidatus Thiodiazotropha sp. (ex. Lucinisca nassula)]
MRDLKHIWVCRTAASIILLTALTMLLAACDSKPEQAGEKEIYSLRLALAMQPGSALVMVAENQGFFEQNGLRLEISEHPSGKRALHDSFFAGKSDIVISADVPVALASFTEIPFVILGSIFSANNINRLIARTDAAISTPTDLKGKKIATQKASAVHFFLHLFLVEHGIHEKELELSFFKAEQLPDKLASGAIDAFSMREPYISLARDKLPGEHIVFEKPGLYQQRDVVISNRDFIRNHSSAVRLFLKSLLDAEIYVQNNPKAAIKIISKRLGVTPSSLEKNWPEISMEVSLDQSMLLVLEDISRWAIHGGLVENRSLPDFLKRMHGQALKEISPDAVTIIQ